MSFITIKVLTDPEKCLERVMTRDHSIHINISDDQVDQINSAVLAKDIKTDFIIENTHKTIDELKEEIRMILKNTSSES
ncbi:MAG: hypothetical protein KAR19_08845 [Bacteroidales bacterium]|nr:hypothetical protein [Bacteroidales bacterium]